MGEQMSILSDVDMIRAIDRGNLMIDPFKNKNLTPNGYDLSVGEVVIPEIIKEADQGNILVPAKTWFAISTLERVRFGPNLVGECWIRTTYARMGIIPSFGKIDAGFEGTLTLNFFNSSRTDKMIEVGDRIAQLVISRLSSTPSSLYSEKSGNYQGQEGVVLNKEQLRR